MKETRDGGGREGEMGGRQTGGTKQGNAVEEVHRIGGAR